MSKSNKITYLKKNSSKQLKVWRTKKKYWKKNSKVNFINAKKKPKSSSILNLKSNNKSYNKNKKRFKANPKLKINFSCKKFSKKKRSFKLNCRNRFKNFK